jgi:hypothetical protein
MHTNGYHAHTHNHCKHDVAYCEHCDVCFCTKCGREWGLKSYMTYYIEPYTWTYRGIPYTVTYGNGDYSLTTTNGTVVKDNNTMTAFYSSVNNNLSTNTVHTHSK